MGLIRKTVTKRFLQANAANSRCSTGPRTPLGKKRSSFNAAKHLILARVSPDYMKELGEDPAKFEQLRQSLDRAFRPQDYFERLLIDEMAEIKWRLKRLRRAEAGLQASQRRKYELDREWAAASEGKGHKGTLEMLSLFTSGLSGNVDSPRGICQVMRTLRQLREQVETQGFSEKGLKLLDIIYGEDSALDGLFLKASYKFYLAEQQRQGQSSDEIIQRVNRNAFMKEIDVEIEAFSKLEKISHERVIAITEAMKDAQSVLPLENLGRILRYETTLERLFERKLQQLVAWRRAKQGKNPDSDLEEWTGEAAAVRASKTGHATSV